MDATLQHVLIRPQDGAEGAEGLGHLAALSEKHFRSCYAFYDARQLLD